MHPTIKGMFLMVRLTPFGTKIGMVDYLLQNQSFTFREKSIFGSFCFKFDLNHNNTGSSNVEQINEQF